MSEEKKKENPADPSLNDRLMKTRSIMLTGEISKESADVIIRNLLVMDSESGDPITVYINSPGGSVYDGLAILDTMKLIKSDVATYGIGLQASMSAILLASGTKGKRYMLPHAKTMIHQPSASTSGKVTDMEIDLKEGLALKGELVRIMTEATGQDEAKVREDMERDYWMTPDEAKAYGIVDHIVGLGK